MEQLITDARAVFEQAVRGAQADQLLRGNDWRDWPSRPLDEYDRVFVVGMGKASMAMASVVERELAGLIDGGAVVVKHGYPAVLPAPFRAPRRIEVMEAGHPVPDEASRAAARRMLEIASGCAEDDLLIVLVSGGGSSLCTDFASGVSLADARRTFDLLLESGADIQDVNTVRKHLSLVGGGRLARAAAPADVLGLVVSDVVGGDPSVIASGPTVPDLTRIVDAIAVLKDFGLWDEVPASVRHQLERENGEMETPKPGDPAFYGARTEVVGSNETALEAARDEARRRGYDVRIVTDVLTGEAREVGQEIVEHAMCTEWRAPTCLLWGGETTVTLRGHGRGGRNTELALAAALAFDGMQRNVALLSGGTDGVDGPTDAAGAWATPQTAATARHRGLEPQAYLDDNDSYTLFSAVDALLKPGPTHTNVMDVQVVLLK